MLPSARTASGEEIMSATASDEKREIPEFQASSVRDEARRLASHLETTFEGSSGRSHVRNVADDQGSARPHPGCDYNMSLLLWQIFRRLLCFPVTPSSSTNSWLCVLPLMGH